MSFQFRFKFPTLALGLCLFFFSHAFSTVAMAAQEEPLQGSANISSYQLSPQKPLTLTLNLHLPEGYHAYADKFKLEIEEPEGFSYHNIQTEPLVQFYDEVTKKKKMGMEGSATLTAPLEAPTHLSEGDHKLRIALTYQACTKSYCLFPAKLRLEVPFSFFEEKVTSSNESSPTSVMGFNFEVAMKKGLFWTFLLVFIAGFLTSLTPCIFPIIPITIAVLGRHAHLHSHRKNFLLSVLYVLGIALTYAALGIFAAATGSMFGSFMSHPIVLTVICLVFFAMSLSMFGLFELQAPAFIRNRLAGDLHVHGYHSAFIYGLIAGVVAGPCVGPVLVGVLTFVAKSQNMWLGFWMLFDFALGMGLLFLAIGFSSQVTKMLPKSGGWMETIKHFFGVLMLSAFFNYLGLLVSTRIWDASLGLCLVVGGSLFGAFTPIAELSTSGKVRKGLCQMIIFVGAAFMTIGLFDLRPALSSQNSAITSANKKSDDLNWLPYSEANLALAKKDKKPVLIDFWADWCGACKELEQYTFSTDLFKKTAKSFVLLKFDATNESDELAAVREKYGLVGLPTLVFYDSNGELKKNLFITEFVEAPILVERMKSLLK